MFTGSWTSHRNNDASIKFWCAAIFPPSVYGGLSVTTIVLCFSAVQFLSIGTVNML